MEISERFLLGEFAPSHRGSGTRVGHFRNGHSGKVLLLRGIFTLSSYLPKTIELWACIALVCSSLYLDQSLCPWGLCLIDRRESGTISLHTTIKIPQ